MKVNLQQTSPSGGYNEIVEMPAVPREGEVIALNEDGAAFTVRTVIWTPFHSDYDVQVRFR